jgi:hypothetical protein
MIANSLALSPEHAKHINVNKINDLFETGIILIKNKNLTFLYRAYFAQYRIFVK